MNYSKSRIVVDMRTGEVFRVEEKHLKIDKDIAQEIDCINRELEENNLLVEANEVAPRSKSGEARRRISWMHAYMSQTCEKLAHCHLSIRAYRVLFFLASTMKWGNKVEYSLADVNEQIGVDAAHVSRAITELEAADCLLKIDRGELRINPTLFWVGSSDAQPSAVADYYRIRSRKDQKALKAQQAAKRKEAKAKAKKPKLKIVTLDDYRDTTAPPA